MTREELIAMFVRKRAKGIALTWTQFAGAVQALTADQKEQLLLAVNNGNKDTLSQLLLAIVSAKKIELATVDVDAIVADDNLTIDEILTLID